MKEFADIDHLLSKINKNVHWDVKTKGRNVDVIKLDQKPNKQQKSSEPYRAKIKSFDLKAIKQALKSSKDKSSITETIKVMESSRKDTASNNNNDAIKLIGLTKDISGKDQNFPPKELSLSIEMETEVSNPKSNMHYGKVSSHTNINKEKNGKTENIDICKIIKERKNKPELFSYEGKNYAVCTLGSIAHQKALSLGVLSAIQLEYMPSTFVTAHLSPNCPDIFEDIVENNAQYSIMFDIESQVKISDKLIKIKNSNTCKECLKILSNKGFLSGSKKILEQFLQKKLRKKQIKKSKQKKNAK